MMASALEHRQRFRQRMNLLSSAVAMLESAPCPDGTATCEGNANLLPHCPCPSCPYSSLPSCPYSSLLAAVIAAVLAMHSALQDLHAERTCLEMTQCSSYCRQIL